MDEQKVRAVGVGGRLEGEAMPECLNSKEQLGNERIVVS